MDMGRASSSGTRSSPSSHPFSMHHILTLRRILAASGSYSSTGTAGFVTAISRTERSPSPQSCTSSWLLDSGASFSYDFWLFYVIMSLFSWFSSYVLTADSTPLPVTSRGTLSTPSFLFLMFLLFLASLWIYFLSLKLLTLVRHVLFY
jgi:hypothetical protein